MKSEAGPLHAEREILLDRELVDDVQLLEERGDAACLEHRAGCAG